MQNNDPRDLELGELKLEDMASDLEQDGELSMH